MHVDSIVIKINEKCNGVCRSLKYLGKTRAKACKRVMRLSANFITCAKSSVQIIDNLYMIGRLSAYSAPLSKKAHPT